MVTPIVFLSHSSKDKDLAINLATDLRKNGVETWLDKWEILPGDSFRRKIDEGISQATHFVVLLTTNSLESEWVQTEIDAAMIRKIEGQCRLIPVLYKIDFKEMPLTLRGLSSVYINDYKQGIESLIDTCYGLSQKPPLGKAPIEPPLKGLSFSSNAQRLAALLCKRSETGLSHDPVLDIDEVEKELSLSGTLIEEAADELKDAGFLKVTHLINAPTRISTTTSLFWSTDAIINGWDTAQDAKTIASALVNKGEEGINLSALSELLNWQLRRINPAATFLVEHGLAEASKVISHPYAYQWLRSNVKTRRFADETTG